MFKDINDSRKIVDLVIIQARRDVLYGDKHDKIDALRYLRSNEYRAHERLLSELPNVEKQELNERIIAASEDMYRLIKHIKKVIKPLSKKSLGRNCDGDYQKQDVSDWIDKIETRIQGGSGND